jgi:hypothetical protein
MMESREDERARLLIAMADGAWYEPAGPPEHRRQCYVILNELAREGVVEQRNKDGGYAWRLAWRDALLPYSSTHPPGYAVIKQDPAPTWKAWWVWPEKKMRGAGPLTLCCAHRHREYAGAVNCAKTRCEDVRGLPMGGVDGGRVGTWLT